MILPMTLLLFQKFLRKAFLVLISREPKVAKRGEIGIFLFSDYVYTFILLIVPIVLSFYITSLIK